MLFVFIFGWKCVILDRNCARYKREMSEDYFSRIGDEIEMLIWMGKWRKIDKELT